MKISTMFVLLLAATVGLSYIQREPSGSGGAALSPLESNAKALRLLPQGVLFMGEAITVFEEPDSGLALWNPDARDTSCTGKSDEIFRDVLPEQVVEGTQYYRIKTVQENGPGADRVWVYLDRLTFLRIGESSFKEIDKVAKATLGSSLFLLVNDSSSYVLYIGQESVSSGLGLSRRVHLVHQNGDGSEMTVFYSVSNDPRRVKLVRTGELYFVRTDYNWDRTDEVNGPVWLEISVLSRKEGRERVLRKDDVYCPDINKALQQLSSRRISE
ncbi:MAG: hypothetical protein KF831_12460 [Acidobacteria bacterium]|nr:hypothetical protein [Acidobacteriota bacterium]